MRAAIPPLPSPRPRPVTTQPHSARSSRDPIAPVRRRGVVGIVRAIVARARSVVWSADSLVIFRIESSQVQPVPVRLEDDERWTYRAMRAAHVRHQFSIDLPDNLVAALDEARGEQRVHIMDVDGHVAAWGFSAAPANGWPLWETGSTLVAEEGAVCLFAFETLPAYRGRRLYPSIMLRILAERFQDGASAAYIWCRPTNAASYAAIKRVGFEEVSIHRSVRLFGFGRRSEQRPHE